MKLLRQWEREYNEKTAKEYLMENYKITFRKLLSWRRSKVFRK
jgi:hypothetical protein